MALVGNLGYISLLIQFLLLIVLLSGFVSVSGKKIKSHCRIMNTAVVLQVISVLIFMTVQMSSFAGFGFGSTSLGALIWLHHLAGLLVFMLAIYIYMALKGRSKFLGNPYKWMRVTFYLWILVFIAGVSIYLELWQGIRIL